MASLEEQFEQALAQVLIDDSGRHILEVGAVKECVVSGDSVKITMDLPPEQQQRISQEVEERLKSIDGINHVTVQTGQGQHEHGSGCGGGHGGGGCGGGHSHSHGHGHGHGHSHGDGGQAREAGRPTRSAYLENYRAVVAVGSGKGGVGKSTVAVNLAVSLARMGHKVSLFDADIYGPSVPIMMGVRTSKPDIEGDNTIIPLEKHGIHMMSIGNLVEEAAATIWRGPVVHQVIDQLLRDTKWPGGDFMIIDMPPGTGDVQLTLSQVLELAGAVIVSTPQDVALLDAVKAISMFAKVNVPVLGLVENMSAFVCPSCQTETPIFDKGNAQKASGQNGIPFLGAVPIETSVREAGDNGTPISELSPDSASAKAFRTIAENLVAQLEN